MKMEKITYPYKENKSMFQVQNHMNDFDDVESVLLFKHDSEVEKPLVSILIPVYNAAYFDNALLSALNQDFVYPYEIVIVDNQSTNSEGILEFVKKTNSPKVRLFKNSENIGMFGNWNRCIWLARAQYISFLHADDEFVPQTLTRIWNAHVKLNNDSVIVGRYITIGKNGKALERYHRYKGLLFHSKEMYKIGKIGIFFDDSCNGCSALMSKAALLKIGGYNPNFYPNGDRVLMTMMWHACGMYRINFITRRETQAISTSTQIHNFAESIYYFNMNFINTFWNRNAPLKKVVSYFIYKRMKAFDFKQKMNFSLFCGKMIYRLRALYFYMVDKTLIWK